MGISQLNTDANEIVYENSEKTSELNWKVDSAYLIDLDLQYLFLNRFILNTNLKKNYNESNTNMTNHNYSSSTNTTYSDTTVKDVNLYDLNLKYLLYAIKNHIFFTQIGAKQETYKWEAKNNEGSPEISYEQDISNIYLGLGIISNLFSDLQMIINYNYSNNVKIEAYDIHHNRTTYGADYVTYSDHLEDGTMEEKNIAIYFMPSKTFSIYFAYNDTNYKTVKGYTDINFVGTSRSGSTKAETAGANNKSTFYKIGLRYFF